MMPERSTLSGAAPPAAALDGLRFAWPGARDACLDIPGFAIAPGERVFLHGPSGGPEPRGRPGKRGMTMLSLAWQSARSRRYALLLTLGSIILSVALLLAVERLRHGARDSFTAALSGTDLKPLS